MIENFDELIKGPLSYSMGKYRAEIKARFKLF